MISIRQCFLVCGVACATLVCVDAYGSAAMPSTTTRYATDAYPGFDREETILEASKKTPRWFSWWNGPKMTTAADQFKWAQECAQEESWRAARKAYDALVREWPSAPEAPRAQLALANILLEHELDYEAAFEEYKYLLDYYSFDCNYDEIAFRLYQVAQLMREEGKRIIFFRFANTVDVRRAFEAVVLRAPGAKYAPQAMLTIAALREDDGEYAQAIQVYENLRNLHAREPEAKTALYREARARMTVLREHAYNRSRLTDTVAFLKLARASTTDSAQKAEFEAWLTEAVNLFEDEAYAAAKFYDSRTRTQRSAINAYERFLADYPASKHVPAARARLAELQQTQQEKK